LPLPERNLEAEMRTLIHQNKEIVLRAERQRNGKYIVRIGAVGRRLRALRQPLRRYHDESTGETYTAPGFPQEFETADEALDAGEVHVRRGRTGQPWQARLAN
jgi:hypothetical protein